EQAHPAGKFLFDSERSGVLQMGAADFDDAGKFFSLAIDVGAKCFGRGDQAASGFGGGGDVHGGGKGVVGGLRHIDVIVGMDGLLAAHCATGDFDCAVADDFVDVHVGLGAAAGLPDAQRKMIVEFSGNH